MFDLSGAGIALTITGLPTDTYTVEEVESAVVGDETVSYVDVNGYRYDGKSYTIKVGAADETDSNAGRVEKDTVTLVTVTNEYTKVENVKLKKLIRGNAANPLTQFPFTVAVTEDGETITVDGLETSFNLTDNGEKLLANLPIGATVTITESNAVGFTMTVTSDNTDITPTPASVEPPATDNGTRSFTFTVPSVADGTTPTVTVTNKKSIPEPPTGLGLESTAYIVLMALALFGMVSGMAARKRRARR